MHALHVIGVNLELRARIGLGVRGQQQAVIALLCPGFLCIRVYHDATAEYRSRAVVEDAPVPFVAACVRLVMVDPGIIVDVLAATGDRKSVQRAFSATPRKAGIKLIAHQPAAQCDAV